jgi:hypothetical protein
VSFFFAVSVHVIRNGVLTKCLFGSVPIRQPERPSLSPALSEEPRRQRAISEYESEASEPALDVDQEERPSAKIPSLYPSLPDPVLSSDQSDAADEVESESPELPPAPSKVEESSEEEITILSDSDDEGDEESEEEAELDVLEEEEVAEDQEDVDEEEQHEEEEEEEEEAEEELEDEEMEDGNVEDVPPTSRPRFPPRHDPSTAVSGRSKLWGDMDHDEPAQVQAVPEYDFDTLASQAFARSKKYMDDDAVEFLGSSDEEEDADHKAWVERGRDDERENRALELAEDDEEADEDELLPRIPRELKGKGRAVDFSDQSDTYDEDEEDEIDYEEYDEFGGDVDERVPMWRRNSTDYGGDDDEDHELAVEYMQEAPAREMEMNDEMMKHGTGIGFVERC